MEMPDFSWQHQKYARPEIYVVTLVPVFQKFWHFMKILSSKGNNNEVREGLASLGKSSQQ